MELLGRYKNGNFHVAIFDDGTKIRETNDEEFTPDFAENMDIKICNVCDVLCPFCHEGSTKNGKLGDILNEKFIDTLHPYQEVAIGGGDITSHPDLIPFLQKLKEKKVIANITVNQVHFERKQELIKKLVDEKLIYGLGVSLVNPTEHFLKLIKQYPNAVIHVINGILSESDVEKLQNNDLKMLILGYKHLRRGNEYFEADQTEIENKQRWLYENLESLVDKFKVVSFDNLAIEQLQVKRLLSQEEWDEFYMGDDSEFTYYIDMVERRFAKSSTASMDQRYDLLNSVDDMFEKIRKKR
ncbi:radical SAM protein [Clostridium sp. MCC344]|nr:radical SAM protein [Clostridium sp. MCC344]MBT9788761.1 radical SAM protein [Clostridium sp. MCC344]